METAKSPSIPILKPPRSPELNEALIKPFPSIRFPESALQFSGKSLDQIKTSKKSTVVEDRRKALQTYLSDISFIPALRDSTYFEKFIELHEHMPDVACASGISAHQLLTGYDLVRGAAGESEVAKKVSQEQRRHSENFERRPAAQECVKSYRTDHAQRREQMRSINTENFLPERASVQGRNFISKMISSTRATKMEMTLHGKVKDMVKEDESEPSEDEVISGKGCEASSSSASRYSKVAESEDQRYYSWGGCGGSRDRIVAKNKPKFNAFKLKLSEM